MLNKKCLWSIFSALAVLIAVAGAAYMIYDYLAKRQVTSTCIECDSGTEFEAD